MQVYYGLALGKNDKIYSVADFIITIYHSACVIAINNCEHRSAQHKLLTTRMLMAVKLSFSTFVVQIHEDMTSIPKAKLCENAGRRSVHVRTANEHNQGGGG